MFTKLGKTDGFISKLGMIGIYSALGSISYPSDISRSATTNVSHFVLQNPRLSEFIVLKVRLLGKGYGGLLWTSKCTALERGCTMFIERAFQTRVCNGNKVSKS